MTLNIKIVGDFQCSSTSISRRELILGINVVIIITTGLHKVFMSILFISLLKF